MPSIKDLKKRIGTVKNTQQTTRAMKMVSAAKLRRAQEAISGQRPYALEVGRVLKTLLALPEVRTTSRLVERPNEEKDPEKKLKVLLVLVTSDRGLCGGFNSNVIKSTQKWIAANRSRYESIRLSFIGKKAFEFFKFRLTETEAGKYFGEFGGKVTFLTAKKRADSLVELFLSGEFDEVKFVYNEFKNAVTQKVVVEDFLPLKAATESEIAAHAERENSPLFLFRPDPQALLEQLLAKHFAVQAFRILLESQASEHGARMSAMENATKNAGEMIRKLTLLYNKQRQAGITKELLEIISGSESQKAS